MPLDVIGVGFGRTGTMSLKLALERLGFGPCHHMTEVLRRQTADVWAEAAAGKPMEWDAIFAGYRATVDWPACHYWRELAAHWPAAKIILTTRDAESWYRSTQETIFGEIPRQVLGSGTSFERVLRAIADRDFGGSFTDRDKLIAGYERHVAEVLALAPPDRFFAFNVADGWLPLCEFLGVLAPAEPFPRANERAEFMATLNAMREQNRL